MANCARGLRLQTAKSPMPSLKSWDLRHRGRARPRRGTSDGNSLLPPRRESQFLVRERIPLASQTFVAAQVGVVPPLEVKGFTFEFPIALERYQNPSEEYPASAALHVHAVIQLSAPSASKLGNLPLQTTSAEIRSHVTSC